jgi:hypothetical protein
MVGVSFSLIGLGGYFAALFVFGLLWRTRDLSRKISKKKSVGGQPFSSDPLLALYGSGRKLWADEHADEYVKRLREGWK